MDEIKKNLEGEQIDNLEGTSPSALSEEVGVELNSSPVPTEEEISDANNLSVDSSDTPVSLPEESENVAPVVATEEEMPSAEKLFTQSQVNDLVGKTRMETREQTYRAVYGRYGVEDEVSMDELVGNAQRYDTIRGEYDEAKKGWEATDLARNNELTEVKEHVALLESGIDRNRFDDARAIIKSKGLELTVENINKELSTHPEWKKAVSEVNPNFAPSPDKEPQSVTPTPESTIKVLGNEGATTDGMSEEEYALKNIFKI